ncbi:MAG: hypothetical protein R2682_05515 [Pyrinomonadaceae bacterium]
MARFERSAGKSLTELLDEFANARSLSIEKLFKLGTHAHISPLRVFTLSLGVTLEQLLANSGLFTI